VGHVQAASCSGRQGDARGTVRIHHRHAGLRPSCTPGGHAGCVYRPTQV